MSRVEVVGNGHEQPTVEQPTADLGAGPEADELAPPGSLLAELRRRTEEARRERTLDLTGTVYGDLLVLRYGVLPVDELERYSALQGKVSEIGMALDVLVRCCRGVYGRREDGELEQLQDAQGEAVGLDTRLAKLLAVELPVGVEELTAREVVTALFGNNAVALGHHVERLVEWMNAGGGEPGEASAARR